MESDHGQERNLQNQKLQGLGTGGTVKLLSLPNCRGVVQGKNSGEGGGDQNEKRGLKGIGKEKSHRYGK